MPELRGAQSHTAFSYPLPSPPAALATPPPACLQCLTGPPAEVAGVRPTQPVNSNPHVHLGASYLTCPRLRVSSQKASSISVAPISANGGITQPREPVTRSTQTLPPSCPSAVPHRLCQCNSQKTPTVCPRLYLCATCHFPGPPGPTPKWSPASILVPSSLLSSQRPGGHFPCAHWIIPLRPINTLPLLLRGPSWSTRSHTVRPGTPLLPERPFQPVLQRPARQFLDCTRLPPASGISYLPSFCCKRSPAAHHTSSARPWSVL